MADNTTLNNGSGGDVIATDDLTTLNGGGVAGVKVQRVKIGFGSDGTQRDVDAANGLPVLVSVEPAQVLSKVNSATNQTLYAPIPAVAGKEAYLTFLQVIKYATATVSGGATPVTVSTFNLNVPAFFELTFPSAQAIGTTQEQTLHFARPIKAAVATDEINIAAWGLASIIWRINVGYFYR